MAWQSRWSRTSRDRYTLFRECLRPLSGRRHATLGEDASSGRAVARTRTVRERTFRFRGASRPFPSPVSPPSSFFQRRSRKRRGSSGRSFLASPYNATRESIRAPASSFLSLPLSRHPSDASSPPFLSVPHRLARARARAPCPRAARTRDKTVVPGAAGRTRNSSPGNHRGAKSRVITKGVYDTGPSPPRGEPRGCRKARRDADQPKPRPRDTSDRGVCYAPRRVTTTTCSDRADMLDETRTTSAQPLRRASAGTPARHANLGHPRGSPNQFLTPAASIFSLCPFFHFSPLQLSRYPASAANRQRTPKTENTEGTNDMEEYPRGEGDKRWG